MDIAAKLKGFLSKFSGNKTDIESDIKNTPVDILNIPEIFDLNLLIITDTHGSILKHLSDIESKIKNADILLFLGDVYYADLDNFFNYIKDIDNKPIFGIIGNHDDLCIPNNFPEVHWIDGKTEKITVKGKDIIIGGLSGSIKYKNSDYCLRTHKESVDILDNMGYCDILITHDKPMFDKPEEAIYDTLSTNAHSGLYGIGKYIIDKYPKMVIHGHIHDRYIQKINDTTIKCCYLIEEIHI